MNLYLDDLHVGQIFKSRQREMTEHEVKDFALHWDPQPFHLDDDGAESTVFGTVSASGWHTALVTMALLLDSGLPFKGGLIAADTHLTWPNPTRPGDVLEAETEILAITASKSRPERGSVKLRTTTRNQRGDTVLIMEPRLIVTRRMSGGGTDT